jgi:hypothetical protein
MVLSGHLSDFRFYESEEGQRYFAEWKAEQKAKKKGQE